MSIDFGPLQNALRATVVALNANTAAIRQRQFIEEALMASITDLTDVVTAITADDSALKTAIDNLVAAVTTARASSFDPASQAQLDTAVTQLQQAHADLVSSTSEAVSATGATGATAGNASATVQPGTQ